MAQDQRAGEGPAESVAAKILRVPTAAQMWAWFSWFSLPVAKLKLVAASDDPGFICYHASL